MADAFHTAHQKLLNNLLQVSQRWDGSEMEPSKTTRRLMRYQEFVSSGHFPVGMLQSPFMRLLESHRTSINRGPTFDAWLKNDKVMLALPAPKQLAHNTAHRAEVHLGSLYRAALELRDQVQNDLDSTTENPELNQRYAECRELVLPTVIRLNLYRVFVELVDPVLKPMYTGYIAGLERELGLGSGADDMRLMLSLIKDENTMLGTLLSRARPALEGLGINVDAAVDVIGELVAEGTNGGTQGLDMHAAIEKITAVGERITAPGKQLGEGTGFQMNSFKDIAFKLISNPSAVKLIAKLKEVAQGDANMMDTLTNLVGSLNEPETLALFNELTQTEGFTPETLSQLSETLRTGAQNVLNAVNKVGGTAEHACAPDGTCVRPTTSNLPLDTFEEEE